MPTRSAVLKRRQRLEAKGLLACCVCGFDLIVEIHHLDGDRKHNAENNLVPVCPNHHRMLNEGIGSLQPIVEKWLRTTDHEHIPPGPDLLAVKSASHPKSMQAGRDVLIPREVIERRLEKQLERIGRLDLFEEIMEEYEASGAMTPPT